MVSLRMADDTVTATNQRPPTLNIQPYSEISINEYSALWLNIIEHEGSRGGIEGRRL